jgi:hypothetical protein
MNEVISTVIFWSLFVFISGWVLRHIYFSKDETLSRKLRITSGIIFIVVSVLLFFPWLPGAHGGSSGWGVALQGDTAMTLLAALLWFFFVTLFFPKKPTLIKAGVISNFAALVILFGFMISTTPETITLTSRDVAPIIVVLLLLINNLVLFLLWNELDKSKKKI